MLSSSVGCERESNGKLKPVKVIWELHLSFPYLDHNLLSKTTTTVKFTTLMRKAVASSSPAAAATTRRHTAVAGSFKQKVHSP